MLVRDKIKDIIADAVDAAVESNKIERIELPEVKIEYPREENFGDYASSFALESAKILKKSPVITGNILKEFIERSDIIEKVDVVKPGFINIFLSTGFLYDSLMDIIKMKDSFGKNTVKNPKKINLEFVSANPTGPLNVVSARAAALGDTIANLLEAAGNIVDREFYINDFGNQVLLLGESVLVRYMELSGKIMELPEEGYRGEYIKDIAIYCKENYESEIKGIDDRNSLIEFLAQKAIEYNVTRQKADLERFNITYKRWFSEKTLHEKGDVLKTLEFLESKGVIYTEDGKKVFRSTQFGDDKDRVVQRDDGRPTYLLADIAYHKNKMDRGYDTLIDIWGPDHHGYVARLQGAMEAMGYRNSLNVLIAQQVNLIMNGEAAKMSKRLGKFSTMSELINDIGTDVARYFFVMRSMDSHLDFDLDLAKRESSENPVFYLQYAHARICSIFREALKRGIDYSAGKANAEKLDNPEAISLLKMMARFPEEISDAANSCEPHRIAVYLLRLAQKYHKFYTEHRVLSDDMDMTYSYLSLCEGVKIILKNGLSLLGVSAPEKM